MRAKAAGWGKNLLLSLSDFVLAGILGCMKTMMMMMMTMMMVSTISCETNACDLTSQSPGEC